MPKKTIRIPTLQIGFNGAQYGAGGCDVLIGAGVRVDAIAVTYQPRLAAPDIEERKITDEKGAQTWLHERGLPLMVAWGLVNEVRKGVPS